MSVRTGIINVNQQSYNFQDIRSSNILNRYGINTEELLLLPLQPNSSVPTSYPDTGAVAFNEATKVPMFSNGVTWEDFGVGNVSSITAGTGLTATPSNPITTSGTILIANTTVTAGSYTYASITVNAQGQLTAASSGTAPVTTVSAGTGISITGTTTNPIINIANTAVTAGSYVLAAITVNAQGQLTSAANGSVGAGTGISITGTSANPVVNIANTTVTAGSYTYASLTVNAQGQLTAASSGAAPVGSVSAGTGITITGGATTPTVNIANTGVTAGTYGLALVTYNAQGQATSATNTEQFVADWMTNASVSGSNTTANIPATGLDGAYNNVTAHVTTGTGVYTCAQNGFYQISATVNTTSSGVGDFITRLTIALTNGLATGKIIGWSGSYGLSTSGNTLPQYAVSVTTGLSSGDTVWAQVTSSSTASTTNYSAHVSISYENGPNA